MFNRALQVRMVRTQRSEPTTATTQDSTFEQRTTIVAAAIDRGVHKVAMAALAYVALDTLRQVLVATATNR